MIHNERSEYAGTTVTIRPRNGDGETVEYQVEDYWDRVADVSWMDAYGNPAAINYALRIAQTDVPLDDEVLYGKVGAFGHLIHVTEVVTGE